MDMGPFIIGKQLTPCFVFNFKLMIISCYENSLIFHEKVDFINRNTVVEVNILLTLGFLYFVSLLQTDELERFPN